METNEVGGEDLLCCEYEKQECEKPVEAKKERVDEKRKWRECRGRVTFFVYEVDLRDR